MHVVEAPLVYLIHYHEVALKGRNRPWFEKRLVENLKRSLAPLGRSQVRRLYGRILLEGPPGADPEEVEARLDKVFGVAGHARVHEAGRSMEALCSAVEAALAGRTFRTFAVRASRSDKTFPLTSVEIGRDLGAHVVKATGAGVDLERPELPIYVEVLHRSILFYFEKRPGAGGLPVGVSGRVAVLLSGGIDSPVAAWRMLRRGANVFFVHFTSYPFTSKASQQKALEVARRLALYLATPRVHIVPLGETQQAVAARAPESLRVVLYRRFMVRIAGRIAGAEGAGALVTGESLGQVASQTLQNLSVVEEASALPILRPLIGHDKSEIVEEAKRIGTYEISIQPHDDCCTFLMPERPATGAKLTDVLAAEADLDIEALVARDVEATDVIEASPSTSPAT